MSQRRADAMPDGVHCLVEAIFAFDQLTMSAADTGQAIQESGVDGLVDADRMDPHSAQLVRQLAQ